MGLLAALLVVLAAGFLLMPRSAPQGTPLVRRVCCPACLARLQLLGWVPGCLHGRATCPADLAASNACCPALPCLLRQPGGGVLLTPAQLARFDGKRGRRLYLALMGEVYDVTSGARFYGAA